MNFEKCLTENYLVKHGYDYFGKRDLIYLDMYGTEDLARLGAVEWKFHSKCIKSQLMQMQLNLNIIT